MDAPSARIEVLCAGTELLDGKANTHPAFIARCLRAYGLRLSRETALPDDKYRLAAEMRAALDRCEVLLVCGGLGPTFDDLTRQAAAAALGRDLVFRPALYSGIRKKFSRLRIKLPAENRRQAFVLRGARVLRNRNGSAPGQLLVRPGPHGRPQTLVLLPGPFNEMAPMLQDQVLPHLRRTYAHGRHTASLVLHLCGLPESTADQRLKPVTSQAGPRLDFTILTSAFGQVDLYAFARANSARRAQDIISRVRRQALSRVGENVFGEGEDTLQQAVGRLLIKRRLSLAAAESCTAGMFSARLVSAPGSSAYFRGGVLAYHNDLKESLLGVARATLEKYGAVSAQCAREMAQGARRCAGANLGLSITGIAGPAGGTRSKPAGLVFIALAGPKGILEARELRTSGDREYIRQRAVTSALRLLWEHLRT
ncbi:MAG: competence/damage-inducible protein A [Elusimicrobiota bacterium]|jgi:nicotinamide-nucleotide amidase